MVKPVAEGSSQGRGAARASCSTEAELREVVQGDGRASTSSRRWSRSTSAGASSPWACSASAGRKVLPPMEIVFLDKSDKTPVYSFEHKLDWNDRIRYDVPGQARRRARSRGSKAAARGAFMALGCRDVARIDFRMDDTGPLLLPRVQPAARADSGLERPGARSPRARAWTTAR